MSNVGLAVHVQHVVGSLTVSKFHPSQIQLTGEVGLFVFPYLTLLLLRVFSQIYFPKGACCNPPSDYQYWRSYNPKFTTNV